MAGSSPIVGKIVECTTRVDGSWTIDPLAALECLSGGRGLGVALLPGLRGWDGLEGGTTVNVGPVSRSM